MQGDSLIMETISDSALGAGSVCYLSLPLKFLNVQSAIFSYATIKPGQQRRLRSRNPFELPDLQLRGIKVSISGSSEKRTLD